MLPDVLPEPPGLEEPLVPDEPPSPAPAPPDALPELPASEAEHVRWLTQSLRALHPQIETTTATVAAAIIPL
jgi:hypothetical protein